MGCIQTPMRWFEAAHKCEALKVSQGYRTTRHLAKVSDLPLINLDSARTTRVSAKTAPLDTNPDQDQRNYRNWKAQQI